MRHPALRRRHPRSATPTDIHIQPTPSYPHTENHPSHSATATSLSACDRGRQLNMMSSDSPTMALGSMDGKRSNLAKRYCGSKLHGGCEQGRLAMRETTFTSRARGPLPGPRASRRTNRWPRPAPGRRRDADQRARRLALRSARNAWAYSTVIVCTGPPTTFCRQWSNSPSRAASSRAGGPRDHPRGFAAAHERSSSSGSACTLSGRPRPAPRATPRTRAGYSSTAGGGGGLPR